MMKLGELLEKTLPPMGYELVDWEMSPKGRYVRVFIDKPKGVDVEDCARVSRQLTRLFAVENVDFERLEVSSPGLDRPLRKPADFVRFIGEEADFRLSAPIENARRMKGILRGFEDDAVLVLTAQGMRTIPARRYRSRAARPRIEWRKAT
jgi:ribosome maturation factor RimP